MSRGLVWRLVLSALLVGSVTSCSQKVDARTKRQMIVEKRYGKDTENFKAANQYLTALDAAYYAEKPTKEQLMAVLQGYLCMYEYFTTNVADQEVKFIDGMFTQNNNMMTLYNKVTTGVNAIPTAEKEALNPPYCTGVK